MKNISAILITVIVVAGLVGASTYYLTTQKTTQVKNDLQDQINGLNAKFANSNSAANDVVAADTNSNSNTDVAINSNVNSSTAVVDSGATSDAFTLAKLKSATVVISGINYVLTDGAYTHPGNGPFDLEVPSTITLDQKNIAIDTKNANQAAIILAVGGVRHGGATTNFNELEIMTNNAGTPKYLARTLLNDYYQSTISSVAFVSDVVTVKLTPAEGTATTVVYKLVSGALVKQ